MDDALRPAPVPMKKHGLPHRGGHVEKGKDAQSLLDIAAVRDRASGGGSGGESGSPATRNQATRQALTK